MTALNVFRIFSSDIIEQKPALTVLKLLIRVFLVLFRSNVTPATPVSSSLSALMMAYAERRTHVHRTPYARTPNDVHAYTERRTSPLPPDDRTKRWSGSRRQSAFHVLETLRTTLDKTMKKRRRDLAACCLKLSQLPLTPLAPTQIPYLWYGKSQKHVIILHV